VTCTDDAQTDSNVSGGAKVGPAGARAPAVKTCAPAVGWSLNGESGDSSSQLRAWVKCGPADWRVGKLRTKLADRVHILPTYVGVHIKCENAKVRKRSTYTMRTKMRSRLRILYVTT